jgi:hypothetical protein
MLEWNKSDIEGMYFSNPINECSYYRIRENEPGLFQLSELYDNKPYHRTRRIGVYRSLENAQNGAEKREANKSKRKQNAGVSK